MGTLQALQALRVVNHHGQHGDFGRRTCAKGPRHLMPQFQTALGDLPADLICHILALLPIADRVRATHPQCGWLREVGRNRPEIFRSLRLERSAGAPPLTATAAHSLLAWARSANVQQHVQTLVVTKSFMEGPSDQTAGELFDEWINAPIKSFTTRGDLKPEELAADFTAQLPQLQALAVQAIPGAAWRTHWEPTLQHLPLQRLQKLQLAGLPTDDMDLRAFGVALRRLEALKDVSLEFSKKVSHTWDSQHEAKRMLQLAGSPSPAAHMLASLAGCPQLQALTVAYSGLSRSCQATSGLQVGVLPAELHAAKRLHFLQLLHCGVTDVGLLPPGCQQLDVIDSVPVTFSRSSLRAGISQAHQLRVLRTSDLRPEGRLPIALEEIELLGSGKPLGMMRLERVVVSLRLRSLRLTGWDLSGMHFDLVARALDELSQLRNLAITDSVNLTGSRDPISLLPLNISTLGRLTALSLAGNGLTRVPPRLEHCTALRCLDLSRNRLLVESASVGDGGCSCSADVKTDRAAAGAACSRCRRDVGEQLPRQQVVVMESHAAQIVLACLRSLEVLDLSGQAQIYCQKGQAGPNDDISGKAQTHAGAALWAAALSAGPPYLLDNHSHQARAQNKTASQLLHHVGVASGASWLTLCALWLCGAHRGATVQLPRALDESFLGVSCAPAQLALPRLTTVLVKKQGAVGGTGAGNALRCGALLLLGRDACFQVA